MAIQKQTVSLIDFSGGIDSKSAKNAIPETYCEDIVNMDVSSNGQLSKRKGYRKYLSSLNVGEVDHNGDYPIRCLDIFKNDTAEEFVAIRGDTICVSKESSIETTTYGYFETVESTLPNGISPYLETNSVCHPSFVDRIIYGVSLLIQYGDIILTLPTITGYLSIERINSINASKITISGSKYEEFNKTFTVNNFNGESEIVLQVNGATEGLSDIVSIAVAERTITRKTGSTVINAEVASGIMVNGSTSLKVVNTSDTPATPVSSSISLTDGRVSSLTPTFSNVTYYNGLFYAKQYGSSRRMYYSNNGIEWTYFGEGDMGHPYGQFTLIGATMLYTSKYDYTVQTTTDFLHYTTIASGLPYRIKYIAYCAVNATYRTIYDDKAMTFSSNFSLLSSEVLPFVGYNLIFHGQYFYMMGISNDIKYCRYDSSVYSTLNQTWQSSTPLRAISGISNTLNGEMNVCMYETDGSVYSVHIASITNPSLSYGYTLSPSIDQLKVSTYFRLASVDTIANKIIIPREDGYFRLNTDWSAYTIVEVTNMDSPDTGAYNPIASNGAKAVWINTDDASSYHANLQYYRYNFNYKDTTQIILTSYPSGTITRLRIGDLDYEISSISGYSVNFDYPVSIQGGVAATAYYSAWTYFEDVFVDSSDSSEQISSVMSGDSLYFTKRTDPIKKYNGTSVLSSGLRKWTPQVFAQTKIEASDALNPIKAESVTIRSFSGFSYGVSNPLTQSQCYTRVLDTDSGSGRLNVTSSANFFVGQKVAFYGYKTDSSVAYQGHSGAMTSISEELRYDTYYYVYDKPSSTDIRLKRLPSDTTYINVSQALQFAASTKVLYLCAAVDTIILSSSSDMTTGDVIFSSNRRVMGEYHVVKKTEIRTGTVSGTAVEVTPDVVITPNFYIGKATRLQYYFVMKSNDGAVSGVSGINDHIMYVGKYNCSVAMSVSLPPIEESSEYANTFMECYRFFPNKLKWGLVNRFPVYRHNKTKYGSSNYIYTHYGRTVYIVDNTPTEITLKEDFESSAIGKEVIGSTADRVSGLIPPPKARFCTTTHDRLIIANTIEPARMLISSREKSDSTSGIPTGLKDQLVYIRKGKTSTATTIDNTNTFAAQFCYLNGLRTVGLRDSAGYENSIYGTSLTVGKAYVMFTQMKNTNSARNCIVVVAIGATSVTDITNSTTDLRAMIGFGHVYIMEIGTGDTGTKKITALNDSAIILPMRFSITDFEGSLKGTSSCLNASGGDLVHSSPLSAFIDATGYIMSPESNDYDGKNSNSAIESSLDGLPYYVNFNSSLTMMDSLVHSGVTRSASTTRPVLFSKNRKAVPILLGFREGNVGWYGQECQSYPQYDMDDYLVVGSTWRIEAMRKLSHAINRTQQMKNLHTYLGSNQFSDHPALQASGGNDYEGVLIEGLVDDNFNIGLPENSALEWSKDGLDLVTADLSVVSCSCLSFPSRVMLSVPNRRDVFYGYGKDIDSYKKFTVDVNPSDGQEITGIIPFFGESVFNDSSKESAIVVFKEKGIYLLNPKDGSVSQIDSGNQGCTAPNTIVVTKNGIMFANESGIFRLNKDKSVDKVSHPVEEFFPNQLNKLAIGRACAVNNTADSRYMLAFRSRESDFKNDIILVYNYENEVDRRFKAGAWTRYSGIYPSYMLSSKGSLYIGAWGANSLLAQRRAFNDGDYSDLTAAIATSMTTAPLSFGVQGRMKFLYHLITHILAGDITSSNITVSSSVDYEQDFTAMDTVSINKPNKSIQSLKFMIPSRRGEVVQIQITESNVNARFVLSGLSFSVGITSDKLVLNASKST
jgi:hypothetical protein